MTWQDVARRQHGVITVAQLRSAGLTHDRIDGLRDRGDLTCTGRRGVLRVRAAPGSLLSSAWLAALATGGALSHLSAARLWGMELPRPVAARGVAFLPAAGGAQVHVTVPPQRRVMALDGVRIHRVPVPLGDLTRLDGLPITTRRRTALDCLAVLPEPAAVTALDRWLQIGLLSIEDINARLDADRRRHGMRRLRSLARICAAGDAESERRLHSLLRRGGVTGWSANMAIGGYRADVAFRRERVIVEVDGLAHHVAPDRFQLDRTRQNALVTAGWVVLRFTWADLATRPDAVLRTIEAALDQARRAA